MSYNKKIWKTGDYVTQEDINNIENGIYEAHKDIANINTNISNMNNDLGTATLNTTDKTLKGAINELFQSVSNGKELIASAITDKGVTTSNTSTFQQMANNIKKINTQYSDGDLATTILNMQYASAHEAIPNISGADWTNAPRAGKSYTIPTQSCDDCANGTHTATEEYTAGSLWTTFGQWATVYKITDCELVENVGVEITDFKMWRYNENTSEWLLVNEGFDYGNFYLEDFWDDGNASFDSHKVLSSDKKSYKCLMNSDTSGRCFHPFSPQLKWADVGFDPNTNPCYVVAQAKARLIVWDESGPDNRDSANLCINVGGDYWIRQGATFDNQWRHNSDMMIGYFKKLTNDWRYVYMTTCPSDWSNGFPCDSNSEGGSTPIYDPIQLSLASTMNCELGSAFEITYSTNVEAIKHEMSWDGGNTYYEIYPSAFGTTYTCSHEAITDTTWNPVDRYIRVTDINGNTATGSISITIVYNEEIQLSLISDMTVNKNEAFTITYSTNIPAVKHEFSWDGGDTYWDKTSEIISNGTNYTYNHNAETSYDSFNMAIRVTDTNGNISIKTFTITFNSTEELIYYGITFNLSHCFSSNELTKVLKNNSYSTIITTESGYTLESITVGMGGNDITSNVVSGNTITINNVTADIYISAKATSSTVTEIVLNNISNIRVNKGEKFNISYSTNIQAVKHEFSWDGGSTFWDKTSEITSSGTNYTYLHNADTEYDSFNMAIRVTDANGNTSTQVFTIVFNNTTSDDFVFTQYERLNDGIVTDTTDGTYYATINKNSVTPSATYNISLNLASYICICFYDSSDNYLGNNSGGYIENHTSTWSPGALSTTFTIPSNAFYIRACATGDGTQITGTLTKTTQSQPDLGDSNLLDSNGAYLVEDFSSGTIDPNKWTYELGWVRNGETQRYVNTNAIVNDGILELRGIKDGDGNWTSSSIISKGRFAFMYGKIEARIKFCNYWGSFPAFWTLGDSFEFGYNEWSSPSTLGEWWAYCGEFDVVEFYSGNLTCGTFFGYREESGRVWYNNYDTGAWHTFAMEWLEDGTLIFSIDGNELSRTGATTNRAFHIPHFILCNQAVGASGGTPESWCTNMTTYVDWIKYYPTSTDNLVLNSSNFSLEVTDPNDSAHNCMVRPIFNDNCINKSLTWTSSNTDIIICHSGLCSSWAGANGTSTITATSQSGATANITLTVNDGIIRQS